MRNVPDDVRYYFLPEYWERLHLLEKKSKKIRYEQAAKLLFNIEPRSKL